MSTKDVKDRQQLQLTAAAPLTEGTVSSGPFQGIHRILYDPKTHHLHETAFYSSTPSARSTPPPQFIWGQSSIITSHLRLGRSRRCLPQVLRPQLTMQCVLHSQPIQRMLTSSSRHDMGPPDSNVKGMSTNLTIPVPSWSISTTTNIRLRDE